MIYNWVLIYISLMAKLCWAFFILLFVIYISSLVKCLFMSFAHLIITLFDFYCWEFRMLYILDMWFAYIFLPNCGLCFHHLHTSFHSAKNLILMKSRGYREQWDQRIPPESRFSEIPKCQERVSLKFLSGRTSLLLQICDSYFLF